MAWTADASARWANEWVDWEDFPRFWGQAVAWSINAGANKNLETRVVTGGDRARIIVDARDDEGGFLDGLVLNSAVLNPAGASLRLPMQQTAPGRYESSFAPQNEGAYFLTINGAPSESSVANLTDLHGWVMSYSPEYIPRPHDERLLAEIAEITGGRNLAEAPEAVFAHDLSAETAATDIWQRLVLLALLLLPLDIAVRRLIITRSDVQRLRAYIAGSGRGEARSQRMQALFQARGRSRRITRYGDGIVPRRLRPRDDEPPPAPPPPVSRPSSSREPEFMERPPEVRNLGADLLRGRKRRRED